MFFASPLLLADLFDRFRLQLPDPIVNWLTPVWILCVGATLGLVVTAALWGIFWLLSRIPGVGTLADNSSRRWTAIESGQPVARPQVPPELTTHPNRLIAVGPELIYPTTIPFCRNWLGEFSNAVMRADMHEVLERAELNGLSYEGLEDIGMFLAASERGTVCFVNEALGAFRHGPEQNTSQLLAPVMMKAHLAWVALAIAAQRSGRLSSTQARDGIAHLQSLVDRRYRDEGRMDEFRRLVAAVAQGRDGAEAAFLAAWQHFVGAH
jgi:hypothetical protein